MRGFELGNLHIYATQFAVLIFSLTIHECAHAYGAWKLGDPTAKDKGRISLNPLVHLDPIGSVVFPILAIFAGIPLIGWANPVPVNTFNLKNPRRDHAIIAAMGPGSNLVYAVVFAIAAKVLVILMRYTPLLEVGAFQFVLLPILLIFKMAVAINLLLAFFNLIPVPPLDGSWMLEGVVSKRMAEKLVLIRPYGFIIVLALFYTGVFWAIVGPVFGFLYQDLFLGRFLGFHG